MFHTSAKDDIIIEYELSEIQDKVKADTTSILNQKKKVHDELVLTKQLLANVHKNRMNISKQLLDSGDKLGYSSKMAVMSLKQKLDD